MPLYSFRCGACGRNFHRFLLLGEAIRGVPCPECGERAHTEAFKKPADAPGPAQGPAGVCGLHRGN